MFGRWLNPDGSLNGEIYNMLGAMHGTIMVFFGIVPLGFAAFRQLSSCRCRSAPSTWRSRSLNMLSYWFFFISWCLNDVQLLRRHRSGADRLDDVFASGFNRQSWREEHLVMHGHTMVAHGHGVQYFGFPSGVSQLHHHSDQPPCERHGLG
jgi:hypothetical protein